MPSFKYTALTLDGTKTSGIEKCESKSELNVLLEEKSLLLLSSRPIGKDRTKSNPIFIKGGKRIPTAELVLFTRQFSTMFRVGVPLMRVLYILKDQIENNYLRSIVSEIAEDVEHGTTLADAFGKHSKVFPPIYCSMLAAGESSGNIAAVMDKLCTSIQYEAEVKELIKGAMQYPIIVMIALVIAFAILMGFVIPSFLPLFENLGGELPLPTRICIAISSLFTDYWQYLIGGATLLIVTFGMANRNERGKLFLDKLKLSIPLVGPLLDYSYMTRFCSLFAILQSSGILIVDALQIICNCITNTALRQEIQQTASDIESGKSISLALDETEYFPNIMRSMVSIGEASGNLEEMLREASMHFEVEVHHAVKKLTGALGPIIIVIMAIGVGFFALAIYLPIWKLTQLQMNQ